MNRRSWEVGRFKYHLLRIQLTSLTRRERWIVESRGVIFDPYQLVEIFIIFTMIIRIHTAIMRLNVKVTLRERSEQPA